MQALGIESIVRQGGEPRWSVTIICSLLLHLLLFSVIFFVPEATPTRRIRGEVYEVNLVNLPKAKPVQQTRKAPETRVTTKPKAEKVIDPAPAARISRPKEPAKPVVIAKRTIEKKKSQKPKKPKISPSKRIDQALARIEKDAEDKAETRPAKPKANKKPQVDKAKESKHLDQALASLEGKYREALKEEATEGPDSGITMRIYQIAVEDWIKSNWAYPVALEDPEEQRELVAVVRLEVSYDGTILKSWFKKRSTSTIFDQSVLKAVKKSDPLPPFPEGYRKTREEIEIRFNLGDLES